MPALTITQIEKELNDIGFYCNGLSEEAIRYYYTILIAQVQEV